MLHLHTEDSRGLIYHAGGVEFQDIHTGSVLMLPSGLTGSHLCMITTGCWSLEGLEEPCQFGSRYGRWEIRRGGRVKLQQQQQRLHPLHHPHPLLCHVILQNRQHDSAVALKSLSVTPSLTLPLAYLTLATLLASAVKWEWPPLKNLSLQCLQFLQHCFQFLQQCLQFLLILHHLQQRRPCQQRFFLQSPVT